MSGILPGMCWLQPVFAACWWEKNKTKQHPTKKTKTIRNLKTSVRLSRDGGRNNSDITFISLKESRPAHYPKLSSPFKWLLIKRDFVLIVRSFSGRFAADLSPTRVPIHHQEVDILGRTAQNRKYDKQRHPEWRETAKAHSAGCPRGTTPSSLGDKLIPFDLV